jgi:hypothetical protein
MRSSELKSLPFHIFLLSVFPALALLTNNLGQADLLVVQRPIVISILIGILIFLVAFLLVRNWRKASLWTSLAMVMMLSYGHIYQIVEDFQLFGFLIGRHRYLVIFWGVVFILGTWLIFRKIRKLNEVILILNIVSLILVVFQIGQIANYRIRKSISSKQAQEAITDTFLLPNDLENLPDVYLIVLDMYGREDALEAHYNFDNSEFISQLEELGFYVADCARSNYATTALSLASQLNMEYLDGLIDDVNQESTSYLIRNSAVRLSLEEIGYTSIAFNTGFGWADVNDSDIYLEKPPDPIRWYIDPFEQLFIEGTLLRPLLDYYLSLGFGETKYFDTVNEMKAQRVQMVLDHLKLIPQMNEPKFVYAHVLVPHPPHVFNIDGSVNLQASEHSDDKKEFEIQLDYLNPQIIEIVKGIIDESNPSPIIIIEGDHGLFDFQRTSILSAFYFPNGGDEVLFPQISLVNTFRLLFNEYFGTVFPVLDDVGHKRVGADNFAYVLDDEWNPACLP